MQNEEEVFLHNINDCIRVVTHNSRNQSWLKSETELSNLSTSIVNRNNWFIDTVVFVGFFSPSPERKTNDNETLFPVKFKLLVTYHGWLWFTYNLLLFLFELLIKMTECLRQKLTLDIFVRRRCYIIISYCRKSFHLNEKWKM